MDSGLGSDEDRRGGKTKEQKQLRNQQLLSGCFIDASSLSDDSEVDHRRNNERRLGARIFNSSIPQFSMLQMSNSEESTETTTPFNSMVQIEQETHKSPLGFYVDLNNVPEVPETSTASTKNIFSFVIDFEAPKKEKPATLPSRKSAGGSKNGKLVQENGNSLNSLPGTSCNENTVKEEEDKKNTTNPQTYVKLSDLQCQNTTTRLELNLKPRMSRSIPESSWIESPLMMSRSTGYRSARNPLDLGSNEAISTSNSQPKKSVRRLGTDLLRMFLEEIGPDVTVEVENHRIKAHKCILASRCQYFAALSSGNWLEESGNVISLSGFSYEAVYFSLCHIYSGAAHVPDSINVIELASLADMLGLEGLKEVVEHSLKVRYCHNFHKPCPGCCTGVVEVLMLSAAYGLDELYQKTLTWIGQNFVKVWPTRGFSNLPRELREKCYQHHVVNLTPDKVLEVENSCEKILATLPGMSGRWIEPVQHLAQQLIETCRTYHRQHYSAVLVSPSFIALDSGPSWCLHQVEDQMLTTATDLSIEQTCRSYTRCTKLLEQTWNAPFEETLKKIKSQLEQSLVSQYDKLTRSNAWMRLDSHLRQRIKNLLPRNVNPPQTHSTQKVTSSSSSSLRRSLLLAAKSPQVPPSPTLSARKSTLTQPTASSAAKSQPATRTSLKNDSSRSPRSSPIKQVKPIAEVKKTTSKPVKNELKKNASDTQIIPKMNLLTQQRMLKAANSKLRPTSVQNPRKDSKNSNRNKNLDLRKTKKVPVMQRSDTFLKEEPSVIGKL